VLPWQPRPPVGVAALCRVTGSPLPEASPAR
jgi:hypothetical protein